MVVIDAMQHQREPLQSLFFLGRRQASRFEVFLFKKKVILQEFVKVIVELHFLKSEISYFCFPKVCYFRWI